MDEAGVSRESEGLSGLERFLASTKQLLESLTKWSQGTLTVQDVSDVYVRMGNDFQSIVTTFRANGIDMSDLISTPDDFRRVLEHTLEQEATPETLEIYLPDLRAIIQNLLQGLHAKQEDYVTRKFYGSSSGPVRRDTHGLSAGPSLGSWLTNLDNRRESRDLAEETKQENMELRATIANMRQTERERERVWRALNNRQAPSDTSSDTDGSLVAPMNSMVPMDGHMIEYQRNLAYPQSELVHQLPSPADTMNALPTYDYNQQMISYPLFTDNNEQWNTSMSTSYIDEPMTCSPGSQIVIPDLAEEQSMRFHNSPGTLAFDPAVAMRHPSTPGSDRADGTLDPQTPRRLTRSRAQIRRTQSGSEPYPSGSSERQRRRPRDTTPDGSSFSDTLAVIKAQAFGTARKTRTRANRGVSEHAARVAIEVLEARGLSLGVSLDGSDRRRRRSTRGAEDDA